jgi:hypothetical protein
MAFLQQESSIAKKIVSGSTKTDRAPIPLLAHLRADYRMPVAKGSCSVVNRSA